MTNSPDPQSPDSDSPTTTDPAASALDTGTYDAILEPRGAHVEIARNGKEALEALDRSAAQDESRIDLVLMDVMMPVMDGLEATRRLRDDPRWARLPVIMLTAKAMPDDQARCLAAGANDYMAKPLDVDRLLSLVRVWMPR